MKEAMFIPKLEAALRDELVAAAAAAHRPASQVVREFMREYVRRQREARAHDTWFAEEVQRGVRDADDPAVARVAHADVEAEWRRQQAALA